MQRFFTNTIESKFIKYLLEKIPLPIYKTVSYGDKILEGFIYIYRNQIIKCAETGYIKDSLYIDNINQSVIDNLTYTPQEVINGDVISKGIYYKYNNQYIKCIKTGEIDNKKQANYQVINNYKFGDYYRTFTRKYYSQYDYYDSDTHEKLGDYLRCYRDLYGIDLMPFYNCYSGRFNDSLYVDTTKDAVSLIFPFNKINAYTSSWVSDFDFDDTPFKFFIKKGNYTISAPHVVSDNWRIQIRAFSTDKTIIEDKNKVKIYYTSQFPNYPWEYNQDSYAFYKSLVNTGKLSIRIFLEQDTYLSIVNGTQSYASTPPGVDTVDIPETRITYNSSITYQTKNIENELKQEKTKDYKTYQVPIKLNKSYSISIDNADYTTITPAFIKEDHLLELTDKENIISPTEYILDGSLDNIKRYLNLSYNKPILYSLNVNESDPKYQKMFEEYEKYLYLLIQVPVYNESSLFVIEGNYTNTNCNNIYSSEEPISNNELNEKLISGLSSQLFNVGYRYPFSNRLIEYLLLNVIDSRDEIGDNIELVQSLISKQDPNGIWDNNLRRNVFDYCQYSKFIKHQDLNGFGDKDVEKLINRGK